MERLSIMQRHINALREKGEINYTVLNELEHEVSCLTYDKQVLIAQGRKYKRTLKEQQDIHTVALKQVYVFSALMAILVTTTSWIWAYHSISVKYVQILNDRNLQIAKDKELIADAEDRIHNVIEAWNYTSKELNECRGAKQ